jgi:hypothetical protein
MTRPTREWLVFCTGLLICMLLSAYLVVNPLRPGQPAAGWGGGHYTSLTIAAAYIIIIVVFCCYAIGTVHLLLRGGALLSGKPMRQRLEIGSDEWRWLGQTRLRPREGVWVRLQSADAASLATVVTLCVHAQSPASADIPGAPFTEAPLVRRDCKPNCRVVLLPRAKEDCTYRLAIKTAGERREPAKLRVTWAPTIVLWRRTEQCADPR